MISDVLHKLLSAISNQWTWWWDVINEKDELARAVLTISIILLLSIFFYLWTFHKSRNQITAPLPPGPCGLPIVGYLPFLDTNLHHQFAELADQYGPIYKLWLGKKLCVVLNSPSLAKEVVRDQGDIVIGGTDTTATMVEWVMAELLHKPEEMKKVQEELADIVGLDNGVEGYHMPKLHYLDAILKETFRLHPALPLLVPKRPNQSSIVGGYTIPKDTRVVLNVWAIHRDPEGWDDPSEFKPERFLSDTSEWDYNGNNFKFLPFGSGRRICAGIPLAEKMVMYMLASLLHSFNWKVPEGEEIDLSEKFGIIMKKSKPLIAIPTQRLSSLKLYA
ncbi:cytochrome P450 76C2-like [Rhododendron vialii]|uniref:cytochrome P450 76C2-like n=1 Tax=Rhododendron vialii TaxID=182163 RepID=UPI0026605962|nr:cytochrome P450 76C2-like [Rhododendron vialii]